MFKEKPWIRFYSLEPGVPEVVPIIPAHKVKREWMQRNDPPDPENGNMHTKNCPGITKLVSMGYILRAPADFEIKTDGSKIDFIAGEAMRFNTEGGPGSERYVGSHNQHQTAPTLDDPTKSLSVAVKIDTPWRLKASDDVLLLQLPIPYNNEARFTAAQGILDPRHAHVVNVQLYWHVLNGTTIVKAGTPLCQYIPVPRSFGISNIDLICDDANEDDKLLEKAFNYANRSVVHDDTLKSRLKRTNSVMNKYKHRRKTLWTTLQSLILRLLKFKRN